MTLDLAAYQAGVEAADRAVLGRALTLMESDRADHVELAQALLERLLPRAGGATRVGITGVPGVGKSTFINALGMQLLRGGHRVAVLAVDPSSRRSGGSILGDKTRMAELSRDRRAFIRPSASRGALGGVARKTREGMLICEAAGFDVVLVETVGVGQSETEVADMVDCFLVLMLANAGDELQGIKRGVLELADLVAINKADSGLETSAERARQQYMQALRLFVRKDACWAPEVHTVSAKTERGVEELWGRVIAHRAALERAGRLESLRAEQSVHWMWRAIDHELGRRVRSHPAVVDAAPDLEAAVRAGTLPATAAATRVLDAFGR